MAVSSLDIEPGGLSGPWILACDYCGWTTRDIGIEFDKPNNIFGQLAKFFGGSSTATNASTNRPERTRAARIMALDPDTLDDNEARDAIPKDHDTRFKAMRGFYAQNMSKTGPADPLMSPTSGLLDYNSPSSLARIMSLYTGTGTYGKKGTKPTLMRAAITPEEGIKVFNADDDLSAILRLKDAGWNGTTSAEQRANQTQPDVRFIDDLRPVPVLLRTKRSRRCRACRHILVRPEAKVSSVRYRIKLVAANYVPSLKLAPLNTPSTTSTTSGASNEIPAALDLRALPPSRPLQFALTVRNPMFDMIKVTLATPSSLPGSPGSRVTILCPQFDVGANTDVWDEALRGNEHARRNAKTEQSIAEAGKIWERGRNWTTVILEVVGPRLTKDQPPTVRDEEILEIPIYFRIEYETDISGDAGAHGLDERPSGGGSEEKKEKRELAYWCVLGVGKMARVDA